MTSLKFWILCGLLLGFLHGLEVAKSCVNIELLKVLHGLEVARSRVNIELLKVLYGLEEAKKP